MDASSAALEHGRERRKRLTRRALRKATLELGLEHGLGAVSVEAIASRAGVSTRTFFNYFDTKEDAALLQVFTVSEEELSRFAAGPADDTWPDLARLFTADSEAAAAEGADFHRYLELQQRNPVLAGRQLTVFSRFEAQMSAGVTRRLGGGPQAQIKGPLMVGCCITAVRVALARWAATDRDGPVRPYLEETLALVEPAFRV
jgi:AcrR family transcriptional regulator